MERFVVYPVLLVGGVALATIAGIGFWWALGIEGALVIGAEVIRTKTLLTVVVAAKKVIVATLVGLPLYPLATAMAPSPAAKITGGVLGLVVVAAAVVFLIRQRRIPLRERRLPALGLTACLFGVATAGMMMTVPPVTVYHVGAAVVAVLLGAAAFANQQWGSAGRVALRGALRRVFTARRLEPSEAK